MAIMRKHLDPILGVFVHQQPVQFLLHEAGYMPKPRHASYQMGSLIILKKRYVDALNKYVNVLSIHKFVVRSLFILMY